MAPLLFLQLVYGRVVYSAAVVSGWFFLLIVVAAIIAYYFLYGASFATDKPDRRFRRYLWPALGMLVYVSFVYSSVFSLAERPELIETMYAQNQSDCAFNPDLGAYAFRWLHMILGAITVGGFFVGLIGRKNDAVFQMARTAFLYGIVAAMAIGLVYLFTLGDLLLPLMRSAGIWTLTVAIFFVIRLDAFLLQEEIPAGRVDVIHLNVRHGRHEAYLTADSSRRCFRSFRYTCRSTMVGVCHLPVRLYPGHCINNLHAPTFLRQTD